MTDITTVIHWDGRPVEQALLESVNACVRHRNPDGAWVWVDGQVGMAQSDLATLPEDEPGVPVVSGQLRIAASCRIDNRDDIKQAIPHEFLPKSGTDAALILAAYQTWGEGCAARLIGDFAFIIWDGSKQSIFAARDFSGVRQLYYYSDKDTLFLASDRTQILQDQTVPFEVDEEQLIEFLTPTYQWYSGWDQGIFRGFHALPAGCILRAERGHITVRPFFEWQDCASYNRPKKQVLEEYLHTLEEAVRCRLRSRSPVAIELSGGLDSSPVACLAALLPDDSRPDLHTLSKVYDEVSEIDERHLIQPVLDRYPQLSPHFLVADRLCLIQCLYPDWSPKSVMGPHEVWMAPSTNHLYDLAEESGCRVVLTGWIGDVLNEGSDRVYFDLFRRRRFREAMRWFRIGWNRSKKKALWNLLVHGLVPMMAPLPLLRAVNLAGERRYVDWPLPKYYPTHLQKRIREADKAIQLRRERQIRVRCPAVRKTLLKIFPPPLAVTAPFPHPIEVRHPYFDRRLVEMVLSMPQDLKWDPNERTFRPYRLHHREVMFGILPEEVRVGNVGVDLSPVMEHYLTPETMRDWLMDSQEVHIFERGYVLPDVFWDELERPKEYIDWVKSIGWIELMLCIEGFLRAVAPCGQIRRLIPPRRTSAG